MSQIDKLKQRAKSLPKDFTYTELRRLLNSLDFIESNKGKTSGSRVKFFREKDERIIILHKPHPGDIMGESSLKSVIEILILMGEL